MTAHALDKSTGRPCERCSGGVTRAYHENGAVCPHASGPIDPHDHAFRDRPLWVVYGESEAWPQLLCAKLVGYTPEHRLAPLGPVTRIWGYSVYRRQPGFRTLGIDVDEWSARHAYGPFFYAEQSAALEHLRRITTPRAS